MCIYMANGLRVNTKNGKTLLLNANSHTTVVFSCHFHGIYTNSIKRKKVIKILKTYQDHALLHLSGSEKACMILRFTYTNQDRMIRTVIDTA